jgi:hypothetical protein
MFKRITIGRKNSTGDLIDLGLIAECLVFYEKVRVITTHDSFKYLVRCCGPDEVLELLRMGALELEYFDNQTGIQSVETNLGTLYKLITFYTERLKYPQLSRQFFDQMAGPSGKGANRMFNRFSRFVRHSMYTTETLEAVKEDWLDDSYVFPAAKSFLSMEAPEYEAPDPLSFKVNYLPEQGFTVSTNIDFDSANASYHRHVPVEFSSLDVSRFLILIADTRRDLVVGAHNESEFALRPQSAVIAACKFAEVVSKASKGIRASDVFQEEVIEGLPSIREVVNSGEKTFRDVIGLVERADKFKNWLKKHADAKDLRTEYCREVAHIGWADKLPAKAVRFLLIESAVEALGRAFGTAMVGKAAGLGFSTADALLFDKLLKGWTPNQFVEGPLKKFLHS